MKEIEERLNKWEIHNVHGWRYSILSKYQFFLTWSMDLMQPKPNQNPSELFCGYRQNDSIQKENNHNSQHYIKD